MLIILEFFQNVDHKILTPVMLAELYPCNSFIQISVFSFILAVMKILQVCI